MLIPATSTSPLLIVRRHSLAAIAVITVVSALGFTSDAQANLVTNPSFETPESTHIYGHPGLPTTTGDWGGDLSAITLAENGIAPLDGVQMLRFDATGNSANPSLSTSEIWQTIDLSAYAAQIAQGNATMNASAYFNRVLGDGQTDTSFSVSLYAFAGTPDTFLAQLVAASYLGVVGNGIGTDGDPSTWERVDTTMLLPATTDFLAIRLNASENIFNDGSHPEFDGHYADMASAQVVPEPTTLLLLCAGTVGLMRRRRSIAWSLQSNA